MKRDSKNQIILSGLALFSAAALAGSESIHSAVMSDDDAKVREVLAVDPSQVGARNR